MESIQLNDTPEKPVKMKRKKSGIFLGMVLGMLCTVMIFAVAVTSVLVYRNLRIYKQRQEENTPETKSVMNIISRQKVQTIEQIIDLYYYKDDIDQEALEEGMYRGMLDSIGDPYTVYYSEEELADLLEHTEGIYYGIGAYVSLDTVTGLPKIASAIPGTPAEAADLRPDDVIYKVDGQEVYGMDLSAVTALIKGEEGTSVNLTIIREGENDYISVDVVRRKVEAPTIQTEMFEDDMAYIQILEFNDTTSPQFADALATAKGSGMKGLIIDLRANPGGTLESVVDIAGQLLPEGLIVYTEDKYGNREEYSCDGSHAFQYPLVVLIDGNSASASEVLAGAIQDYEIGTLVGTTSFGKGIVQQIITLNDGSAVKITVSSYYTPKGRNIHGLGIEPDQVCEFDGEAYYDEGYDNQLEYAKEVLKEMLR